MRKIENTRFLITGGAGFIGSNLVEHLLLNGASKVVVLDNLSNGFYKNIEPFIQHPAFQFIEGDIRDVQTCLKACENIDCISHQAALGSVKRSIENPGDTNDVNITGFLNMLNAAKDRKVNRFVYASSSSVYGDNQDLPKVEHAVGAPLSPYAVTKRANELYAHVFALNFGMEIIGLRYFNVFGPKQNPQGAYAAVIPLFIQSILGDESPTIKGTGEQTRDFTYIDNVVQANILAMLTEDKQALDQIYNISAGGSASVKGLLEKLAKIAGKDIQPIHVELPKSEIIDSLADISKSAQKLNFKPQIGLEEGLKLTYDWFTGNEFESK
ncbi:MAG: SDR family oxidoreductase [Bacteroidota bacterium]